MALGVLRKISLWQKRIKKTSKLVILVDFVKKNIDSKVRGHCLSTGKYRGPAHSRCNIKVKEPQRKPISVILQNFSNYDCHLFFKTLVDKKKIK